MQRTQKGLPVFIDLFYSPLLYSAAIRQSARQVFWLSRLRSRLPMAGVATVAFKRCEGSPKGSELQRRHRFRLSRNSLLTETAASRSRHLAVKLSLNRFRLSMAIFSDASSPRERLPIMKTVFYVHIGGYLEIFRKMAGGKHASSLPFCCLSA
jgi:hypothetical protein